MSSTPLGACMATPIAASLVAWLQIWKNAKKYQECWEVGNSCVSYSHRIHVCYIYGAPWIPSIYPSHVSIFLPAPWIRHGIVFGSCGRRLPRRITTDPLHSRGSEQSTYRVFSFCLASGWGSSVLDQIFKKCSFKTNMEDVHNCHNMS